MRLVAKIQAGVWVVMVRFGLYRWASAAHTFHNGPIRYDKRPIEKIKIATQLCLIDSTEIVNGDLLAKNENSHHLPRIVTNI